MEKEGLLIERTRGTPQGGVISPILSNLFLHYAFDLWMTRTHPGLPWCRYADDGLVHCRSEQEAEALKAELQARLAECHLASVLTRTDPLSLMKADPVGCAVVEEMTPGCATSGSGARRWLPFFFGQFLCLARGPFLRLGLRFRPRGAQHRTSEERSNPEPRAAPYREHGEDCEHQVFDRREHDATIVVGRDVEADRAGVVRRFGLTGGGGAGSGLRREGPSMRMVMQ